LLADDAFRPNVCVTRQFVLLSGQRPVPDFPLLLVSVQVGRNLLDGPFEASGTKAEYAVPSPRGTHSSYECTLKVLYKSYLRLCDEMTNWIVPLSSHFARPEKAHALVQAWAITDGRPGKTAQLA
jgi:hypothetical protein